MQVNTRSKALKSLVEIVNYLYLLPKDALTTSPNSE